MPKRGNCGWGSRGTVPRCLYGTSGPHEGTVSPGADRTGARSEEQEAVCLCGVSARLLREQCEKLSPY